MKTTFVSILLALLCSTALFAKNIVKVYVAPTPRMHCTSCEEKIRKALQFEKGMKDMEFDIDNNVILLVFDQDKTSLEHLAKKLQKIGYEIRILDTPNGVEADEEPSATCTHQQKSTCLSIGKRERDNRP